MPPLHRQFAAVARASLLRPGPDETYADGDDASWMSVDWRELLRYVDVDGRAVNVLDTGGDKPAIVWLHGLSGRWENWLLNIPQFMDGYRCVAPDLPGFGASAMPAEGISIQGYARVVDDVCRRLGIASAAVVGNSMGGFIGAELALSFPTLVGKLVLVSAAGLSIEDQRREPMLALARVLSLGSARQAAQQELVVRRPRLRRAALQLIVRYPEKLSVPLAYELIAGSGRPGFMHALEALMTYSFRDRLREIEAPALIVWGENDMLVPVADAQRFCELIGENARVVVFEDTGHTPMIERPSRFNGLLREFLAGAAAPEAPVEGVRSTS